LAVLLVAVPPPWRHTGANQGTNAGTGANAGAGTSTASTSVGTGGKTDATHGSAVRVRRHDGGGRIMIISAHSDSFGMCEGRLKETDPTVPTAAILGASYTAGVGPDSSSLAWSVLLARKLGWNAVIDGDSGAGYVSTGSGHRGPVLRMLARIGLQALDPSLVVLQFGHDDIGVPAGTERTAVKRTIATVRAEVPKARVALITVFTGPGSQAGARRTDRVIVSAAKAADPNAIIIDPLTGHWIYQRAHHGLHPSAAGDRWIEQKVAGILSAHGIRAARSGAGSMICDSPVGIPAGPRSHPRTV